jgi:cytochrome c2/cytochrome b561
MREMHTNTDNQGYSTASRLLGWALAWVYLAHSVITIVKARTDRALPLRDELRGWHFVVGALLLVLVAWRLWLWWRERETRPAIGVTPALWHWGRAQTLAIYLLLLVAPVLGLGWGWGEGMRLHLGPIPLPAPFAENRLVWQFSGFFHSGMAFMILLLCVSALLTAGYSLLRHGRGLVASLPPGQAAFVLFNIASSVYALSTFTSPEPGPRAVAIFAAVVGVFWLAGWLIHRGRRPQRLHGRPGLVVRMLSPVAVLLLITLAASGPYQQFRVTPWPMGEVVRVDDDRVWHAEPAMSVTVLPETQIELRAREELYKWCTFCHTVELGDRRFKVGPNLHAIFGQQAATVPGFHYSEALARHGREGLVWTDETLAAYIADPQRFVPGTTMIISSGPIPDLAVQQAIINILKKDVMPPQAITAAE